MHRTRRKQFNSINAPSLARWVILTAFVSLTGLIYVYQSVQLYDLGRQKTKLELSRDSLRAEIDVAEGQINALTSYPALSRRLKEGSLRMIPIADRNIIHMDSAQIARAELSIRSFDTLQAAR